jgi:signal transduction histidine kinase
MSFRIGRLQTKVLTVVLVIVVVPMLLAGELSAHWVSQRFAQHLENLIREEADETEEALEAPQRYGQLLGEVIGSLQDVGAADPTMEHDPIPPDLRSLAAALSVGLIQVYSADKRLLYPSPSAPWLAPWDAGQPRTMLKVRSGAHDQLASVAITALPRPENVRYYLVLGSLIDPSYLDRRGSKHGVETWLLYPDSPREGAGGASDQRLASRIPADAIERLRRGQEYYSESAEDGEYRGLYTPILDSAGRLEAVLFSGLKRGGATHVLADEATLFLVIALAGSLITAATGFLLSRFLVKPIEELRHGVLKLAGQDFGVKVPDRSNDELADLARAFNSMAARLQDAQDEQRRQFQRDKLAALGKFSLALTHEIRNPIGVISTACSLMRTSAVDPDKQAALLQMIREEVGRVEGLLKDFQQLAPIGRISAKPIDPWQPLEEALRVALAGREDIRVERHVEHGEAMVNADPDLLRRAWLNLITNAVQAIGDQPGEIRVTTSIVRGEVVLSLQDSGPGIPAALAPRLFEPFYTTKERGSGLGLTLAHNLVEANGGHLELDPTHWRGAEFSMRFPACAGTTPTESGLMRGRPIQACKVPEKAPGDGAG